MPGIKELKTRIKSISGTRKVTRAMQMVSAAKMRKSQDATTRSRTYASLAWELITNLVSVSEIARSAADEAIPLKDEIAAPSDALGLAISNLLQTFPKAQKIVVLILTTNRGMVGSLNANLLGMVQKTINDELSDGSVPIHRRSETPINGHTTLTGTDIITYGRKGRDVMVRSHKEVLADFEKFDRTIFTEDIFPISELITKLYSSGKYQKVLIFYNHFISTLVQKPTVKQLLPFAPTTPPASQAPLLEKEGMLRVSPSNNSAVLPLSRGSTAEGGEGVGGSTDYLFEPNPQEVLKHLLPRIIESQIYQTILESEASEQSARMVMMKNATEAAGDLISDLTLTYNKLRQNKITTELAEITAGKIALE